MDTFCIIRVNRLRNAAARARQVPDEGTRAEFPGSWRDVDEFTGSWSRSSVDPEKLLGVFKVLRLKEGFGLLAYEFRQGGNGVIWAVPVDAPVL